MQRVTTQLLQRIAIRLAFETMRRWQPNLFNLVHHAGQVGFQHITLGRIRDQRNQPIQPLGVMYRSGCI